MENHISNETAINTLIKSPNVNTDLISDGYHTFGELYRHRIALFKALCRVIVSSRLAAKYTIWKSKHHSDGSAIDGWFIMGIGIGIDKGQQLTYHLPVSEWLNTDFATTVPRAPEWDGHTSSDVIDRLNTLM